MLHRTCVFSSYGSAGHVVHFRCILGAKRRSIIFHDRVGLRGLNKKCTGTRYIELVFLLLIGFVGHVMHSGASVA
jgi:hypothetical protein